jgi:RNA polymerase sigma-70 factor (ECF subfamily)
MEVPDRKAIHEAIVRLADGDRGAFPVLIDKLWPILLGFARRGIGNEHDAEDIAQQVFFNICSRISDFDKERDGLSWAFGIASYEIMTHRRRQQRRREVPGTVDAASYADPGASQEDRFIEQDLASALRLVVGHLSEDDKACLGLTSAAGTTSAAGATLRKRRQRALDRLRIVWRRLHGEP